VFEPNFENSDWWFDVVGELLNLERSCLAESNGLLDCCFLRAAGHGFDLL